ncbi:MAG: hypothetical protein HY393_02115 [Candidatus Diapherotrites archaeon]|nr:hypothetical protein [Candidatus Diapherotrites archaeon]
MQKASKALNGFITLLTFALLSLNALGLSIEAPSVLASHSNWSFIASLNNTDTFDTVQVKLDNQPILMVASNGSVQADLTNGGFVIKAFALDKDPNSNSGLTVYASILGLSEGTHTLNVQSIKNSSITEEKQAVLESVQVGSAAQLQQQLENALTFQNNKIEGLEGTVIVMEKKVSELEASLPSQQEVSAQLNALSVEAAELQENIQNMQQQLLALQNAPADIQANAERVEELKTQLNELNENLAALNNQVTSLKFLGIPLANSPTQNTGTQETQDISKASPATGITIGADQRPILGILALAFLAAVFLGIRAWRKKNSVYGFNSLEKETAMETALDQSAPATAWPPKKEEPAQNSGFLGNFFRKNK